jgi:simple sugar transport system permease protein
MREAGALGSGTGGAGIGAGATRAAGRTSAFIRTGTYLLAFIVVFVLISLLNPERFLTLTNIQQMAFQLPEFGVLAFAMMVVMLSGGIDLSIISTATLSGIAAAVTLLSVASSGNLDLNLMLKGIMAGEGSATAMVQSMPFDFRMLLIILLTVGVALAAGALCGLFNGVLIAVVRIPPILATLGTMKLYEGLAFIITKGSPITAFPKPFLFLGSGSVLHVPTPLLIFAVCAVAVGVMLQRSRLGFSIYAVGMNPVAAKFSGIRNRAVLLRTYLISGLLAGVAALLIISRVDSVKVGYGTSYLLQAVLVVILGGVSHVGGKGQILDVVLSILMLRVISSGFNIAGLTEYFRNIIWGSLLVVVTAGNNLVPLLAARIAERRALKAEGRRAGSQPPGCSPPE